MKDTNFIGARGEHLVCADLRSQGYIAFQSAHDCPYDVVADIDGKLLRVQVKTVAKSVKKNGAKLLHAPSWHFGLILLTAKKGPDAKGHYMKFYEKGAYDILACVALDINKIAYLPFISDRSVVTVRSREYTYRNSNYTKNAGGIHYYFEDLNFEKLLANQGWL